MSLSSLIDVKLLNLLKKWGKNDSNSGPVIAEIGTEYSSWLSFHSLEVSNFLKYF